MRQTRTLHRADADTRGAALVGEELVTGLRVIPNGPFFALDALIPPGRPSALIAVGADMCVDLRIDGDDAISGTHCGLWCKHGRVWIEDNSKNGTAVNGSFISGRFELRPGQVVMIGRSFLLVCGRAGVHQRPEILAADLDAYLRTAVGLYGSVASAGKALGISASTLSRWLREIRFVAESQTG